ncbi:TlpA family protein disulfide reductase [Sediminitomix flava]|uniref:Peroxiredoxin n=1 Tax=Sediminitomix flava TaxID=379075 RepID=A0A315ZCD0_SEDFL|nr:TlpA disulfide reductase family protein [Sediminitomix flava]PWJ43235.1 peroxiredoxin [Sediminitomix flava]
MKHITTLFLVLFSFSLIAQETKTEKPEYVIIVGDQLITQAELAEYEKDGLIKGMNIGVSEEERDELFGKYGDQIKEKEFIIKIELSSKKKTSELVKNTTKKVDQNISLDDLNNEFKVSVGEQASDFSVTMIDGQKIKLSELKGKVVLLNFWATWCAPCLMEFSEITPKILDEFDKDDLVFIPISIGEDKAKVEKKMAQMKKYNVNFNVGIDSDKTIWNLYAEGSIPKNIIIDQSGKISYLSVGNSDGNVERLAEEIGKLVNKEKL